MKQLNLILTLLVVASSSIAIDTNIIYVPLESGVPLSEAAKISAYERQLDLAKNSPESRPAELDPEGHWGAIASGLQVSIRFSTNVFISGHPIDATVILRNTTTNRVILPTSGPWTIDFFVLNSHKESLKATDRSKWYMSLGMANLSLTSRRQLSYGFNLNDIFDLKTPGKYYVSAKRLKDKWGELPEVKSDIAEITIVAPQDSASKKETKQ